MPQFNNPEGQRVSVVHLHSIGIAAINLPLNSRDLEVTPIEDTPMTDGELTDNMSEATLRAKDSEGGYTDVKVASTVTLTASWMPFGSNRYTPPNIRRGEKVCIWRVGDADTYYWSEYEYNADLRKLETVIYLFSDTQKESDKATPENSWFFEVSTHRKIIHLHTGKNDGEPFGFDLQIDAKQGNFLLCNDQGEQFYLESKERRWVMRNSDDCEFKIDKKDLFINVPGNMSVKVGGNYSQAVGGNLTENTSGSWSWSSASTSGKSGDANYNIPTTSYSGLVSVGGFSSRNDSGHGFSVTGDGTFTGSMNLSQNLSVTNINASGNISASGRVSGSNI